MEDVIDLKPKHKNKKFRSEKEFIDWLNSTAHKKITFEDRQQDLSTMWVDERGEILNCDFNNDIYLGKFVDVKNLWENMPIKITFEEGWRFMKGLIIEKIE